LGEYEKYDDVAAFRISAQIQNLVALQKIRCLISRMRSYFLGYPDRIISVAGNKA